MKSKPNKPTEGFKFYEGSILYVGARVSVIYTKTLSTGVAEVTLQTGTIAKYSARLAPVFVTFDKPKRTISCPLGSIVTNVPNIRDYLEYEKLFTVKRPTSIYRRVKGKRACITLVQGDKMHLVKWKRGSQRASVLIDDQLLRVRIDALIPFSLADKKIIQ
jgi:hypothetical protein